MLCCVVLCCAVWGCTADSHSLLMTQDVCMTPVLMLMIVSPHIRTYVHTYIHTGVRGLCTCRTHDIFSWRVRQFKPFFNHAYTMQPHKSPFFVHWTLSHVLLVNISASVCVWKYPHNLTFHVTVSCYNLCFSWARMAKGLSPWYDINFVASRHLRNWMLAGGAAEDKVKVSDSKTPPSYS